MNDNYLMLNGKKVELTEEQIRKLGLKENESIFDKVERGEGYYFIHGNGKVLCNEMGSLPSEDTRKYLVANYCTDKEVLTKRAKEEVLNRLLWRFSMENGWDDRLLNATQGFWYIFEKYGFRDPLLRYQASFAHHSASPGIVPFVSEKVAQQAIVKIVVPFKKGELEVCKIWEEK